MKQNIKYALLTLFSFLMMSCQKSQEYYEGVYIVGADKLSPVANLTIDDLPAVIGIKVASSNAIENNVEVMAIQPLNQLNKTFFLLNNQPISLLSRYFCVSLSYYKTRRYDI